MKLAWSGLLVGCLACAAAWSGEKALVLPLPRKMLDHGDSLSVPTNGAVSIADCAGVRQAEIAAGEFEKCLRGLSFHGNIRAGAGAETDALRVILALAGSRHELVARFRSENGAPEVPDHPQGYLLHCGVKPAWRNTVLVQGGGPAGLLYGVMSLNQLCRGDACAVTVARADLEDYPSFATRMLAELHMPRNRKIDTYKTPAQKIQACKDAIDFMLARKVNGFHLYRDILPGIGQQDVFRLAPDELAGLAWLREVTDYGRDRGMLFLMYVSSAVATEDEARDNPRLQGLMNLRGKLFTWSDDELLEKRARELAEIAEVVGVDIIKLHFPDTVNENWPNRSVLDRERFGDDRPRADAHVALLYQRVFQEIKPGLRAVCSIHPYTGYYLRFPYFEDYLRRFSEAAAGQAVISAREYNAPEFHRFSELVGHQIMFCQEPHRLVQTREGRLGLDRPLQTTSYRYLKSFLTNPGQSEIWNVFNYDWVDFELLNTFAWNADAPGARGDFVWIDRNSPRDGGGEPEFFEKTMGPICRRIFGAQAAAGMQQVFAQGIKTMFLLQPLAMRENTRNTLSYAFAGDPPEIDYDGALRDQIPRLAEAGRILDDLARRPEWFAAPLAQDEFVRVYKEVKLLSWLAPINLKKWEIDAALEAGDRETARRLVAEGLSLVEEARAGLPRMAQALAGFGKLADRPITRVPVGLNSGHTWRDEYLDKYFRDELLALQQGIDNYKKISLAPLAEPDLALVRQETVRAARAGEPLSIDGELVENVWQKAARHPLVRLVDGGVYYPQMRGTAQVAWDDANLYAAIICEELDIDSMVGTTGSRDAYFFNDDIVEIFIQPQAGGQHGHLMANVAKRIYDALPMQRPHGIENHTAWNPAWEVGVKIDYAANRWIVEARIPFDAFTAEEFKGAAAPPPPGAAWRINIGRERRMQEASSIAPCRSFHDTAQYFTLQFEEP